MQDKMNEILISSDDIKKGIANFIKTYHRLPHKDSPDDDITIVDDEGKVRHYKARKYIEAEFGTHSSMVDYYKKTLDDKLVAKILKIDYDRYQQIKNRDIKPSVSERTKLHVFWGVDDFQEDGRFSYLCSWCTKKCKQPYSVDVISCNKHRKTNRKEGRFL